MAIYEVDALPVPQAKVVGLDIETTQHTAGKVSSPFIDRIVTIQISDGKDVWIVCDNFESIKPLLEAKDIIKVIHNANFDLSFLFKYLDAQIYRPSLWDSLLVERVINTGLEISNALADVLARRCGVMVNKEMVTSFADHFGPLSEEQRQYVANDVLYLPAIYQSQMEEVSAKQLGRVAGLECRIAPIVARMSLHGIRYDQALWDSYIPQIQEMLNKIENEIGDMAGLPQEMSLFDGKHTQLNLGSPKQVQALFNQLGFEIRTKDKAKKLTTSKDAIADFLQDNPTFRYAEMLENIITWRQWSHMLSGAYAKEVRPWDGKIHCSWNQVQADTGRFSSSDPNMQNVEKPRKDRPNLRHLFLPENEDYTFLIADYNQQEPRIFAQLSGDPHLREACAGADVYIGMVKQIFGKDVSKGDPERDKAKTGVLADLYGAQPETLANRLKCSLSEAEAFHALISEKFAEGRRYSSRICDLGMRSGQTRTLLGRIRHYPPVLEHRPMNPRMRAHLNNEFINSPVQGSGADMLKLGMDKFGSVLEDQKYDAFVSIVVHDEIVVQCQRDQADEVYYQLVGCMEAAGQEICPDVAILADGIISDRWEKT